MTSSTRRAKLKVLISGGRGQLATDLCQALEGFEVLPLAHADMDITDIEAVDGALEKYQPHVVINAAAYVRVDDCEANPDKAYAVNALGARNVAAAANRVGAKLVHISTDYVFGGEAPPHTAPYTEFDTPFPVNTYGKSKLAGELLVQHLCPRHFIVRTSALFGAAGSSGKGGNFVQTVLGLAQASPELRMVADQVFSPTYSKDLASQIARLVTTDYYGVFHITNRGVCSWYQFAQEILKLVGLKTRLISITCEEYPALARRPHFSVLENYHLRLLGWYDMRTWQEALRDYLVAKGQVAAINQGKDSGHVA